MDQLSNKQNQNSWLNRMIIAGVVLLAACVFCLDFINMGLRNSGSRPLAHDEAWELAGLVWTFLFVAYYFITMNFTQVQKHDKVIVVLLFAIGVCTFLAASFLLSGHLFLHLVFVSAVVSLIALTDWLFSQWHQLEEDKRAFHESYLLTGVPAIAAYLVLNLYVYGEALIHAYVLHTPALQQANVFLSGAISAQLIISNVIFVFLQKGALK
jgi:hypothetical protein